MPDPVRRRRISVCPSPSGPVLSYTTGLKLWLKADAGVFQDSAKTTPATSDGDVIGAWADQSGNGNDATQGTTANKPTLRLSVVNGRPVTRFDGVNDYLQTPAFATELSQPTAIFAVVEMRNAEDDVAYIFDGLTGLKRNAWLTRAFRSPDGPHIYAGADFYPDITAIKNAFYILGVVFDGASSVLYENGTNKATGNTGTFPLDGVTISSRYTTTQQFLDGDISEFLVYNPAPSVGDISSIHAYLNERYAIY